MTSVVEISLMMSSMIPELLLTWLTKVVNSLMALVHRSQYSKIPREFQFKGWNPGWRMVLSSSSFTL